MVPSPLGFSNGEIFSIAALLFFPFRRRSDAFAAMCTLFPSAHDVAQSHCRPYFAAISQYYIVIYSSCSTLRRINAIAVRTQTKDTLLLYFYFYFVCRTSRIPGELIISVFNFLPLVYAKLCVLNAELLNASST